MRNENEIVQNDGLKREIGAFGGFNILTGIMVGSGIFYLGSYVLMRSGMSQGLALLVWVIGGIITLISGLCYAELGAMMPVTGGSYVYLKKAYGNLISFMSGSTNYVLASCGSVAALALAAANIFPMFLDISAFSVKLIAVFLIVALTVINYCGVKLGSLVQNFFTIAKLIPIVLILILGIFMGRENVDMSVTIENGMSFTQVIQMVAFAVIATFWAYEGWTNLNVVAGEIKNPKRNLPLAIISAIVLVMIIYVLFNFSIYRVLSMNEISSSLDKENYYLGTLAAQKILGNVGGVLVTSTMLIAIIGALNGCILVFPRSLYSMSHNGSFFKVFDRVHPKYETPSISIIVTAVISIALVFSNDLNQLTTLVVFSGLIFNALVFITIFIFRKREPNLERPYKVWLYPLTPIIAVLVMVGMIINTLITDFRTSILGIIITLLSVILYGFYYLSKKRGIE